MGGSIKAGIGETGREWEGRVKERIWEEITH